MNFSLDGCVNISKRFVSFFSFHSQILLLNQCSTNTGDKGGEVILNSEVLIFHGRISVLEAIEMCTTTVKRLNQGRGSGSIRIFSTRIKIGLLLQADSICFRMEETSRGLLQHKHRAEQLKQEKTALTLSYEVSCHR